MYILTNCIYLWKAHIVNTLSSLFFPVLLIVLWAVHIYYEIHFSIQTKFWSVILKLMMVQHNCHFFHIKWFDANLHKVRGNLLNYGKIYSKFPKDPVVKNHFKNSDIQLWIWSDNKSNLNSVAESSDQIKFVICHML
jgi:general stress protein CsbA